MIATTVSGRALLALASLAPLAASCGNDAGADTLGDQGDTEPVTLVTEAPPGPLDGVYESVRGPGGFRGGVRRRVPGADTALGGRQR